MIITWRESRSESNFLTEHRTTSQTQSERATTSVPGESIRVMNTACTMNARRHETRTPRTHAPGVLGHCELLGELELRLVRCSITEYECEQSAGRRPRLVGLPYVRVLVGAG